jgi:hypothetical protein
MFSVGPLALLDRAFGVGTAALSVRSPLQEFVGRFHGYGCRFVRGPPAKASESPESERWSKSYAELIEKSVDFIPLLSLS